MPVRLKLALNSCRLQNCTHHVCSYFIWLIIINAKLECYSVVLVSVKTALNHWSLR